MSGTNDTAKVELAYPTTFDGKDYAPDDVVDMPRADARQFVQDGRGRWHDQADKDTDGRPVKGTSAKKATASSRATAAGASKGEVTSG